MHLNTVRLGLNQGLHAANDGDAQKCLAGNQKVCRIGADIERSPRSDNYPCDRTTAVEHSLLDRRFNQNKISEVEFVITFVTHDSHSVLGRANSLSRLSRLGERCFGPGPSRGR